VEGLAAAEQSIPYNDDTNYYLAEGRPEEESNEYIKPANEDEEEENEPSAAAWVSAVPPVEHTETEKSLPRATSPAKQGWLSGLFNKLKPKPKG
jgi:hypothetical protein